MKVYQSGGMRKHLRFNVDEGRKVTEFLRHIGWEVVSPWEMDEAIYGPDMWDLYPQMPAGMSIEDCLKRDFAEIEGCDAIVLMDSWVDSDGAKQERRHAESLGKEVWRVLRTPDGYQLYQVGRHSLRGGVNLNHLNRPGDLPFKSATFHNASDVTGEIRVVDPRTGGEKGQKPAKEGSLDPWAISQVSEVAGFGQIKYSRLNYMRGYDWSSSYDAMQRHLKLYWGGQDDDEESGLPHLAHAAWHCLALMAFAHHGIGTDDRYHGHVPG